jgi:predicted protein tyrosine phosphatase
VTHPTIQIMGYSEAAMFLHSKDGPRVGAILSICGAREFSVVTPASVQHRLVLHFDDADSPDDRDPVLAYRALMQRRRAEEYGRPMVPPTIHDARSIIEFARSIADLNGTLLCQCQAGVSRSPAAALLCLATWTGTGHEGYCVEHVMRCRACAMPHRQLVAFGDNLLGLKGALVEALKAWGLPPSPTGRGLG